jgi:cyanophycin synthetase
MRVLEVATYRGPHLFSHTPMIRIQLDLGILEEWPSDRLPGFADTLLAALPGLQAHGCSYREAGGFVRRLRDGTWLGHVAEHMALELQTEAGSRVTRGKTRSVRGRPGVYNVLFAYRDEAAGRMAGRLALGLLDSLLPPELQGIGGLERIHDEDVLAEGLDAARLALKRAVRRGAFGPTTLSLVREAERRGIPVMRLDRQSLVQLGHGRKQQRPARQHHRPHLPDRRRDRRRQGPHQGAAGRGGPAGAARRGGARRRGRRRRGAAHRLSRGDQAARRQSRPRRHAGPRHPDAVRAGFAYAARESRSVIVEQQLRGHDHRILVIGGEVRAVAQRVPPTSSATAPAASPALVEEVNRDPRRGTGHENLLTRIVIDDHVLALLGQGGLTPDSVPAAGACGDAARHRQTCPPAAQPSTARKTSTRRTPPSRAAPPPWSGSTWRGSTSWPATSASRCAETGGRDRRNQRRTRLPHAPGALRGLGARHRPPGHRDAVSAGRDRAHPRARLSPAPTARAPPPAMVAHILAHTGLNVGMTGTNGVWIGAERVMRGDCSGPRSARMVLRDPTVDAAVLETARGGILREGWPSTSATSAPCSTCSPTTWA